jgi:trehalose synthase
LAAHASLIYPALDPLSHKNRDLAVNKLVGVLVNSGLQPPYGPVPSEDYEHQVERIMPDGSAGPATEMGLLFRPIVLQVSRWDRLKGWLPLMEGFVRMKQAHRESDRGTMDLRNRRRVEASRLVLAGPDPASISDDPEGLEVLRQIRECYASLDPELQDDVAVLLLPMASRKENALIVNALQRCSTIVTQNSLQEGFGLTVTEAMWKHMAVLGSQACGIRQQIRDRIDGYLLSDPESPDEIALYLKSMLTRPHQRYVMGRSAQRRVYDEFLVFKQISRYLQLLYQVVTEQMDVTDKVGT